MLGIALTVSVGATAIANSENLSMKAKQVPQILLIFILSTFIPVLASAQGFSIWEIFTKTPEPIFKDPQKIINAPPIETDWNRNPKNRNNLVSPIINNEISQEKLITPHGQIQPDRLLWERSEIPTQTPQTNAMLQSGDMIHIFFRCLSPDNNGVLCRVKGPADIDQWDSPEGREKGYGVKIFENISISSTPIAIYDSKNHIHVFAPRHTGDLGGAIGLQYYRCETESLACTAASNLILESQVHFKPSLILVKGQQPEEDFIMGFYHGGYGGQLGVFRVNINDLGISNQWVHDNLSDSGKESCGQHANIDKSPSAQLVARNGGSEIHLWARAGHGNPLHLWLRAEEFNKMISGEDYQYNCEKFNWEGQRRFHSSPTAIVVDDTVSVFAAHRSHSVAPNIDEFVGWYGFLNPEDSSWQLAPQIAGINPTIGSGASSVQLAPEEAPFAILGNRDSEEKSHYIEVFFNYQHPYQEPNDQMLQNGFALWDAIGEDRRGRGASLFLARIGEFGTSALDTPAAVRDTIGNTHVFAASPMSETGLRSASIFHWKLSNNDPGARSSIVSTVVRDYPSSEIVAHPYGAERVAATGRSGIAVILIPANNFPSQGLIEGPKVIHPHRSDDGSIDRVRDGIREFMISR